MAAIGADQGKAAIDAAAALDRMTFADEGSTAGRADGGLDFSERR
jgi:hypothetical protein